MNPYENFEPVSASGSENPLKAYDAEPESGDTEKIESAPATERSPDTASLESGSREKKKKAAIKTFTVAPDLGPRDRRYETDERRHRAKDKPAILEDDDQAAA